jgi:hypothetical protein
MLKISSISITKINKVILSFVLIVVVSGCKSTPKATMSTLRLNSPEISSEPLRVNLAVGLGSRSETYLEDGNSDEDDIALFGRASITFASGWQISIQDESDDAQSLAIQYQFYGEYADKADKGNFSQSLRLGYERKETDLDYREIYWQHDSDIFDIYWILGYRLSKNLIVYGGPFYYSGNLDGYYQAKLSEQRQVLDEDGELYGSNIALEYRFDNGFGVASEIVISETSWGEFSHGSSNLNVKFDYQF